MIARPEIEQLARTFRAHDKQLYLIGGTVRDQLLGRASTPDLDLTTDALPAEVRVLAKQAFPGRPLFTMGDQGEQFGTVVLLIDEQRIEITTYRTECYNPDSRKPEVTFGTSLEGDLSRRDFTINALAADPLTGAIIDPFNGQDDIEGRRLCAVGNADERFSEDPLRLLRAVRFAVQLDFTIEDQTYRALVRQAEQLAKISKERIAAEFTKILTSPHPASGLQLLVNSRLMEHIVPEVLHLHGVSQRPAHHKDVFLHTCGVVQNAPPEPLVRWAALLHDIAKPRTKSVENGKVHFFGHEEVGAQMARDILSRLRFDNRFTNNVMKLVRMHMRSNAYTSDWTDGAIRRLMLEMGDELPYLLQLSQADITSYRPEKVTRAVARVQELERRYKEIRARDAEVPPKSPLDGHRLMALFNRPPGPWLKPLIEYLKDLVIDGILQPTDEEGAMKAAKAFMEQIEAR